MWIKWCRSVCEKRKSNQTDIYVRIIILERKKGNVVTIAIQLQNKIHESCQILIIKQRQKHQHRLQINHPNKWICHFHKRIHGQTVRIFCICICICFMQFSVCSFFLGWLSVCVCVRFLNAIHNGTLSSGDLHNWIIFPVHWFIHMHFIYQNIDLIWCKRHSNFMNYE